MSPTASQWFVGPVALVLAIQGKHAEASTILTELDTHLASDATVPAAKADILSCAGPAAIILGDRERVARYRTMLQPFSGRFANFMLDRILGSLSTFLGDWPAAWASLDAAEARTREPSAIVELAWTLVAKGDLCLAEGGAMSRQRARAFFEEAEQIFARINTEHAAGIVAKRLHELASVHVRASTLPAGLSMREVEVLRLVAAGLNNRAIADQLFISEKTVANHLTSIFTKTGTQNRVGAVAFALRHGLAPLTANDAG